MAEIKDTSYHFLSFYFKSSNICSNSSLLIVQSNFPCIENGIHLRLEFRTKGSKWQSSTQEWGVEKGGGWLSKSSNG